ncbi:MAG: hypothetical protein HQK53_04965 [Oligoflexia bacterium]|nr:hypothetical protein [Oligoflexia bacterium]
MLEPTEEQFKRYKDSGKLGCLRHLCSKPQGDTKDPNNPDLNPEDYENSCNEDYDKFLDSVIAEQVITASPNVALKYYSDNGWLALKLTNSGAFTTSKATVKNIAVDLGKSLSIATQILGQNTAENARIVMRPLQIEANELWMRTKATELQEGYHWTPSGNCVLVGPDKKITRPPPSRDKCYSDNNLTNSLVEGVDLDGNAALISPTGYVLPQKDIGDIINSWFRSDRYVYEVDSCRLFPIDCINNTLYAHFEKLYSRAQEEKKPLLGKEIMKKWEFCFKLCTGLIKYPPDGRCLLAQEGKTPIVPDADKYYLRLIMLDSLDAISCDEGPALLKVTHAQSGGPLECYSLAKTRRSTCKKKIECSALNGYDRLFTTTTTSLKSWYFLTTAEMSKITEQGGHTAEEFRRCYMEKE